MPSTAASNQPAKPIPHAEEGDGLPFVFVAAKLGCPIRPIIPISHIISINNL